MLVFFNGTHLTQQNFNILIQLPDIIKDSGEVGLFQLDVFSIEIIKINELQNTLIKL